MNLEKLNKCPLKVECVAKAVWRDKDNGSLFRLDTRKQEFVPHKCSTKGASELPKVAFAAAWKNESTERTRYIGPFRSKDSALNPPIDNKYKRRGGSDTWTLVALYQCVSEWREIPKE